MSDLRVLESAQTDCRRIRYCRSRMVPPVGKPVRKRHADNPLIRDLDRILEAPFLPLAIASSWTARPRSGGARSTVLVHPDRSKRRAELRLAAAERH
jgi:hypothetical protein